MAPDLSLISQTEFSLGQPDGRLEVGVVWSGSWVLRTSCGERLKVGKAEFRESAAGDEPHCLLCLVCVPNRADGWSHSSSYKQLRPPLLPPGSPVLSSTVCRELEVLVVGGDRMRRWGV